MMNGGGPWLNWEVQVPIEDGSSPQSAYCIVKDEDEFVSQGMGDAVGTAGGEQYIEECHTSDETAMPQGGEWQMVRMSQVTTNNKQSNQSHLLHASLGSVVISPDLVANNVPSASATSNTPAEKVKCPECNKSFSTNAYLRDHIRVHTGEKPHACDECGQAFAQKCNLRMHKRIHTGERPFACGVCGRNFSRSSHLKGHMLQHTGDKPYSCDICGQQFTNSQGKKNHMRLHLGERPFQCEICNITFTHKPSLKIHIKTHRRDARYYCAICKRKFIFRSALYEHMTFHSKNKLYECDQCHKRFKQKHYLKKHKSQICGSKSLLHECEDSNDGAPSSVKEASQLKYRVLNANERALPRYLDSDEEEAGDAQDAAHLLLHHATAPKQDYLDDAFVKVLKRTGYVA